MKAVNLVPNDQRRALPSGKQSGSAYVLIGLLAVLLVMAAGYVLTSNNVNERKSQAAAAKAEADRLEAEAAARGAFTSFAQIKEARLAAVGAVADSRFDWERLMRELAKVMPEGSWIQSTDASTTGEVTGSAAASSSETALIQPKANLVGCTPHQSDVARMMVRMRQMHRVTDVELNESRVDIAGSAADVSFDSCGSYYQFDLTVEFEPAPPQREAPRGESSVPASLGGGS
jgi:Tfp pilus assembly protein PilN